MTATFDPAISSQEDADTLSELGYTQELHRGIGGYAAFASGFSFVSILTTVFAFFPLGFALGGQRQGMGLALVVDVVGQRDQRLHI